MQGGARNTGDPSARPWSGRGEPYEPEAKSAAVQRESEGIVVPETVVRASGTKAVQNDAAGGKGPRGGHVAGAGKRKGMAGETGPNDPGGGRPRDNVRGLRRRLWVAAKRDPGRRFHALYDHIWRDDVLREAWRRVRKNKGAAGVDGQTLAEVLQYGVERLLKELGDELRAKRYRPGVVERRCIPKADGRKRPLGIPYLHVLDALWTRRSAPLGTLVRYADDVVVVCRTRRECEEAEKRIRVIMARLGLELHPEKTRRAELYDGEEGFDFLGHHLHERVRELTPRRRCHEDTREVIVDLNPVLRGWGNYFRTGNAAKQLNPVDSYVWRRLKDLRVERKCRNPKPGEADRWTREYFWNLGLHRLRGAVRYPARHFFAERAQCSDSRGHRQPVCGKSARTV